MLDPGRTAPAAVLAHLAGVEAADRRLFGPAAFAKKPCSDENRLALVQLVDDLVLVSAQLGNRLGIDEPAGPQHELGADFTVWWLLLVPGPTS